MKNTTVVPNQPGVNTFSVELSEDLQLNAELAKKIVDTWYTTGEGYNYDVEPSKPNNAGKFIVPHIDIHNNVFRVHGKSLY